MTSQFTVRPGVYYATVQGEGVVMDLARDHYYGLGPESAAIWEALCDGRSPEAAIHNLVAAGVVKAAEPLSEVVARQLEIWEEAGLLSVQSDDGEQVPTSQPSGAPAARGLDPVRVRSTHLSPALFLLMVIQSAITRRMANQRGMCWVLRRIQQIPVSLAAQPGDLERELYRIVRAYYSYRRLRDQGKEDCVWRSLLLASVLRRRGIDAQVCFGVRKFPFTAHAWVEALGNVVNDVPRKVQPLAVLARF